MKFCTNCGAGLEPGRFCTNCGAPVSPPAEDDPTATSVRLPAVQPDASTGARYPLFADAPGQGAAAPTQPAAPADPPPAQPTVTNQRPISAPVAAGGAWAAGTNAPVGDFGHQPPPADHGQRKGTRPSRAPWIALLVVLLLMAAAGGYLLLSDEDDADDARGAESSASSSPGSSESTPAGSESPSETPSAITPPEADPDTENVAASAQINAPAPLAPRQDVAGNPVSYPVENMLDDDPATAYRISGDATGAEIIFTLDADATISSVGMVNGYAKSDGDVNWYRSNRKIQRVVWSFDDGTEVEQTLRRTTDLQVLPIDGVRTRTVRLRLLDVSKPGPNPRNTTAISSIEIQGTR